MAVMSKSTLDVLEYVRTHAGVTVNDITDALTKTHTKEDVASALWTLWNGKRVTREQGSKTNDSGLRLFAYTFKTDTPRKKRRRAAQEVAYEGDIEVMVAVKGEKETVVLPLDQVMALVRKFKHMV